MPKTHCTFAVMTLLGRALKRRSKCHPPHVMLNNLHVIISMFLLTLFFYEGLLNTLKYLYPKIINLACENIVIFKFIKLFQKQHTQRVTRIIVLTNATIKSLIFYTQTDKTLFVCNNDHFFYLDRMEWKNIQMK